MTPVPSLFLSIVRVVLHDRHIGALRSFPLENYDLRITKDLTLKHPAYLDAVNQLY